MQMTDTFRHSVDEQAPCSRGVSRYVPALDGLRAVAISIVLIAHSNLLGPNRGGSVGVDIFFTVSGYLITTILLNQWVANGRIALGSFYLRRVLRIWPAFLAMLIVYVAASSLQSSASTVHLNAAMSAALSIMNWVQAFAPSPMNVGFVGHTWSLSIEEQFY